MLTAENITKEFAGVVALKNVCLELHPGKVNAIVGENGAGKSTLMKILSGVHTAYEGQILLNGKPVCFDNPREAQKCGIAIIHQELNLIPTLNITENIFLGREITTRWGSLDQQKMRGQTEQLLEKLGLTMDPNTLVGQLKVGQQQVVEIAKALLFDSQVIIMDEPTSAISESEVSVLFDIIEGLKRANKTIVYISHKLDELFKIADRYIILRDGRCIESGEMNGINQNDIIRKMVGREMNIVRKPSMQRDHDQLLSVDNISLKHPTHPDDNLLNNISFHVGRGEIVGIFGLMGAGRTELLETLFGLQAGASTGEVLLEQQEIELKTPSDAIKAGIAFVPEDRKKDGLVLGMDLLENITLPVLHDVERFGLLNERKATALTESFVRKLKIKTASINVAVENLSGGNQQKIVLAKWLAAEPKVLMLDEPTRGIDVNAKNEIYKLIMELAGTGLGIIMVSSELPEILALSDRILVMSEGNLTAEIPADIATEDMILKAAIPNTI